MEIPPIFLYRKYTIYHHHGVRAAAALCLQDLFDIARSILVQLLSSFLLIHLVIVHVVHPYSSIDTTIAWKEIAVYFIW